MKFEGEHLLPGQIGHFFIILSFIAALLSVVSFFFASRQQNLNEKTDWLRLGNISFYIQAISTIAIFFTMFYICFNHYYEYMYA